MTQHIVLLVQDICNFIHGRRNWFIAMFCVQCYTTLAVEYRVQRYKLFLSFPHSIILMYEMSYFYHNIVTILWSNYRRGLGC
jgi:hypothetical protein